MNTTSRIDPGLCSVFHSCFDRVPSGSMNLQEFVTDFSSLYKNRIGRIRNCQDDVRQKKMKSRLPAITPAGIFTIRRADSLREPSGYMSIDLDNLEGKTTETKELLMDFPGLCYCGLSVRGNGLFLIIKIASPEKYVEHLEAVFNDLKELGLSPDPACKDISRLRFVSYDPDPVINFEVSPYTKLVVTHHHTNITDSHYNKAAIAERVECCLDQIDKQGLDITNDYRDWISIAYALGNEFGEGGRKYFHLASRYYPKYDPREADRTFTACLKGRATTVSSFFWICKRNGIRW